MGEELRGRVNSAISRLEDVLSGNSELGEEHASLLNTAHGCASQLEALSRRIAESRTRLEDILALRKVLDDPEADFSFNIKFRLRASADLRHVHVDKERGSEAISLILDDLTQEAERKLRVLIEDVVEDKENETQ